MATRPLSRARILQAAFALADEQGLDNITMRGVASKLEVEAMSLYHYVPNKKAMVDGLVDLLIQVAGLPTGEVSVQEWITGFAEGLRSLAQQHPRLIALLSARAVPLDDPKSAMPFEAGLSAFTRAGYSLMEGFAAVQAVALSLLSMAQLEATATLEGDTGEASGLDALSAADFPLLHRVLASPAGLDDFWNTLVGALVLGLPTRS